jgi:hypothetical protein
MRFFLALMLAPVLLAELGTSPQTTRLVYQDSITAPSGTEQNVTAIVEVQPRAGGMDVTVDATGAQPFTVHLAPGEIPAPQNSPTPEEAQGALIVQRVALMGEIRRALPVAHSLSLNIPALPPGGLHVLALQAELRPYAGTLTGSASVATTATIDPQKAPIKGIMPARRVAERVKNALTPSHVTLPDDITTTVSARLRGANVIKLGGHTAHALNAHGQTTTLNEYWSLKPS